MDAIDSIGYALTAHVHAGPVVLGENIDYQKRLRTFVDWSLHLLGPTKKELVARSRFVDSGYGDRVGFFQLWCNGQRLGTVRNNR